MDNHPRIRNIAVLIVLILIYAVPASFLSHTGLADNKRMMDIVSVPMLLWGLFAFIMISREAVTAFWDGRTDRTAYALFGLSLLFLSVDTMRAYGVSTRNVEYLPAGFAPLISWVENTSHIYAIAIYMQFIGIWFFTRASFQPTVRTRTYGVGQVIAGIIIGVLLTTSKLIEPIIVAVGKFLAMIFH